MTPSGAPPMPSSMLDAFAFGKRCDNGVRDVAVGEESHACADLAQLAHVVVVTRAIQ